MYDRPLFRISLWLGFAALVVALSFGVYSYGLGQAMGQIKARGQSDLALAEDRLTARLRRYQELAVTMADHPSLSALQTGGSRAQAEDFLRRAADKTGALALGYVSREGRVLARAGAALGEAAWMGAWTARAQRGALGTGHAFLPEPSGALKRSYFFAAPEFGPDGTVRAVLVVAVDIDEVEFGWRSSRPAVFFTDALGRVFISNRSELLFARLDEAGRALELRDGEARAIDVRLRRGEELWTLDLGPYLPRRALHLTKDLPVIGMRAEALIDVAPAERLARLQAIVFGAVWVAFGAILYLLIERRRTLARANAELEARVAARTAELSRVQADLVQAGKLSALGQMSAGISHELNQPLMAIGQFAENARRFMEAGKPEIADENLGRIAELSTRAARIIKNLRAFARNESEAMGKVDLDKVIRSAIELTETRLRGEAVELIWEPSEASVFAVGGEVRLTQVFVNLINNAVDAMAGQEAPKVIRIVINNGKKLAVTVRDTGPGIADPEKIFEPFYTTREVGDDEGMGLGLSISYGLVQSFGGNIRGQNATLGRGALFTVELEYWQEQKA